jgi:hypothetical protein
MFWDLLFILLVVLVLTALLLLVLAYIPSVEGDARTAGGKESAPPVVHVAGPSGAGKTTLGKAIKERWPNASVFDLDEITGPLMRRRDLAPKMFMDEVKKATSHLIKRSKGPVVFVGMCEYFRNNKMEVPDAIAADYKYFLLVDDQDLVEQRWNRDVKGYMCQDVCKLDRLHRPVIDLYFNANLIVNDNHALQKKYKKLRYTFLGADAILADLQKRRMLDDR